MLEFKYAECIAKIIVDETANEKVAGLRIEAMITLYGIAQKYAKEGFLPELVEAFFEKKSEMIMKAETEKAMKEILKPSTPYYSAGKMMPKDSPYYVEEEELMLWSRTSFRGPLIDAGQNRYMELFKKYLPDKAKLLWKDDAA